MYAHYFASKSVKTVVITTSMRPVSGITYAVKGKAEARKIAAANNAKPYNF